jgi:hypothetical protein
MRHALLYAGGFEKNFTHLKPGATTFTGTDGAEHTFSWPAEADGVRISFMEKAGKHFVAVRVQHEGDDIVLERAVLLEASRHLGGGKRFGPEPIIVENEVAKVILEDAIARNESQRNELAKIRVRLSKNAPSSNPQT